MKKDLRTEISRNVTWKMKTYAKDVFVRTMKDLIGQLRFYATEAFKTNVGSTVIIALNQQVFEGMYICFNGCKTSFRNDRRKVVAIDGYHLRVVLEVFADCIGFNSNDCIYPFAYIVVHKENIATWLWFLNYLAKDIEIGNGRWWTSRKACKM